MKKCPTCQKTFEGAMRFCQTDGTPLVEVVEEKPIDPLKTMVVGPGDLPELVREDPMKTMVVNPPREEDILQVPESYDPMKTMVSSDSSGFKTTASEPKVVPPASGEPVVKADRNLNDTLAQTPELPKFNEPNLSPPDMGDWGVAPPPPAGQRPVAPIAPPPDEAKPPVSNQPKFDSAPLPSENRSPFEMPKSSPVVPPSPFEPPPPPSPFAAKDDEPMFGGKQPPFEKSPFGQPQEPLNRPSAQPPAFETPPAPPAQMEAPMQAAPEWAPPPAPVAEWQDQGLGQNTPFQPPVAGTGSKNQTLAIVSMITGIISLLCCTGLFVPGIVAAVLGFIARGKASSNPNEYGGSGMAMAGIILGLLNVLFSLLYWALMLLGVIANPLLQN